MSVNYIGIDPSITSTGMVINGEPFSYSYDSNGYTKKGDLSKWFKLSEHVINFRFHEKVNFSDYQNEQVKKITMYSDVVETIIYDIKENIDENYPIKIAIEGYSYGSNSGNLIDLVTFGTLLRYRLLDLNCEIFVISPSTLKLESCKMTYPPIEEIKGKRKLKKILSYKNNEGISGGNFTKKDMYKSVLENIKWDDKWKDHLHSIESDIGDQKIPKPHEDVTDAYLLYQYIKLNG